MVSYFYRHGCSVVGVHSIRRLRVRRGHRRARPRSSCTSIPRLSRDLEERVVAEIS